MLKAVNESDVVRADPPAGRKLRVAVTGGSGRVGGFVVEELLGRGHEVVIIDRKSPRADLLSRPGLTWVFLDLRNRELLQPALAKMDAICHLGEIPHSHYPLPPNEIFAHNVAVGSTVLQTAADLKLGRVIYTSSCQVYGWWGDETENARPVYLPVDEKHPLLPTNVYALSKVANESYAQMLGSTAGLSIAIIRFPWALHREPSHPDFQRWFENRTTPEGFGAYIHGTDLARMYAMAVEQPREGCEVYTVSARDICMPKPASQIIADTKGPGYPALPRDWWGFQSPINSSKAREHFGWEPRYEVLKEYQQVTGKRVAG